FQARDKSVQHVWGTSWGVSTRLVGGVIMTHGDDSGLVLPPRVAPYQVVIVPIGRENWRETVLPKAKEIQAELVAARIRVTLDERDERPGWKFSEWELRGVPLRVEIGPKDIDKSAVLVARRDTREKQSLPMDGLAARLRDLLDEVQVNLFDRARRFREEQTQRVSTYDEFRQVMEGRPGFVIAPWCGSAECEAHIKTDTQATIRNMPITGAVPAGRCVRCDRDAKAVKRHAAAALGQRKVCRRPRGHPSRPRGRVRGFTFAHALDHRKDDGRRDRAAHCADCIAQHNRIVGQHPARGAREYGQLIVPLPAVLPLPPFLLVPPH